MSGLRLFPVPADLTPESGWRLVVDGLVERPLALGLRDLRALPASGLEDDFRCEEGWTAPAQRWRGVPLRAVLKRAGLRPDAAYLSISSGGFVAVLPLASVSDEDPLLALELNGEPLPREHGGPLRLVAREVACFRSVKWVDRIEATSLPANETALAIATARVAKRSTP
jgi:DMSO/TMAO reductase YedYZ molybdopterin-dependent catalytic subunit